MQITVSGAVVPAEALSFFEWHASQWRSLADQPFEIRVEADAFLRGFQPTYEATIQELLADDAKTGAFEPPYAGATEYPSVDALFALAESQRMEFFRTYFEGDVLRSLLAEEAPGALWYALEVSCVNREAGEVVVRGRAIASQRLREAQQPHAERARHEVSRSNLWVVVGALLWIGSTLAILVWNAWSVAR